MQWRQHRTLKVNWFCLDGEDDVEALGLTQGWTVPNPLLKGCGNQSLRHHAKVIVIAETAYANEHG